VERRSSLALIALGLLGTLIWIGVLARGSAPAGGPGAVAADVDASIRETAAAVRARADTLAQMPRLSWAVATDEATVRNLTADELAFRPQADEHIEIAQIARKDGQVRTLLHLSAEARIALPMSSLGSHLLIRNDKLHVVDVVGVAPHERSDELRGAVAVSRALDLTAVVRRLDAAGIGARIRTADGSLQLGAVALGEGQGSAARIMSPAAAGATLAISGGRRPAVLRFGLFVVFALMVGGGAVLWRRAPPPPPWRAARPSSGDTPTPVVDPEATPMSRVFEESGALESGPFRRRAPAMPTQSGSLPSSLFRGEEPASGEGGPVPEEYRALFEEYVDLRRRCGESVDDLDCNRFAEVLQQQRQHLIRKLAVRDVSFRLAFDNGKAVIHFKAVA
jgi:hypothetical protein